MEENQMRNPRQFVLLLSVIVLTASAASAAIPLANCNSTFTICSIPENVLVKFPFSAIAGDVIVMDPTGTTVSDVFRIFNDVFDAGAGTGLGSTAILYSADDSNPLPAPSTYSANAVFIKEIPSGFTNYLGNGTNYQLDTSAVPTRLVYTGNSTADYHDPAQLSAVLTGLATGTPIPGAAVAFTLGPQSCTAVTNATGVASCGIVLSQPAGKSTVIASFAGIFGSDAGISVSNPFAITLEQTTLSYTGDSVIANGGVAHMSGVLLEDSVTPIAGRTVTFTIGTGAGAQTCNGSTDTTGKAACTISPVSQSLGPGVVGDSFAGDAFYLPASATANLTLFAFPATGDFVVGNQSALPGASVTFWGAQWSFANVLSGGPAPASLKGFAETLTSEPPNCGINWTTRPGNSSGPPLSVPAYLGVLVTPSVAQVGASLSGATSRIVVLKTDPGYAPDPEHPGTGTIVAQFCH
jgi:hypothetical protein